MANRFPLGSSVRCYGEFRNAVTGDLSDPTSVSCQVQAPTGGPVTYAYPASLVKDSTGKYHVEILPNIAGTWRFSFTGSGIGTGTDSSKFEVVE